MLTSTMTAGSPRAPLLPALLLLAGLSALYLPSFNDLFHGPWSTDRNAHGPIVMVVAFAYMYFRIRQLLADGLFVRAPAPLPGAILLGLGLVSYALGRSQNVLMLEVGSLILVLSGLLIFNYGVRTWSRLWFAFFFMLFMIPLPASIVDVLTLPMKIGASAATEHLLYWAGYPIARSGVILTIGQYQLLVADACAGLNSLFTLEALGLLYMNLVRHPSVTRNVVLALLIVPISFSANTIRIVFLSLITYHFGDAAGQGFMHGFSGLVLFLSALMLIIFVDSALNWLVRRQRAVREADPSERGLQLPKLAPGAWHGMTDLAVRPAVIMFAALLVTAGAAYALTPRLETVGNAEPLTASVPERFGDWTAVETPHMQAELATAEDGGAAQQKIYDDVLMRTYVNSKGEQVMVALAYAREQRQDVKLHLPEVCYPAQGYKVIALAPANLQVLANGASVPGKHMLASGSNRLEAVTYWTRVSDAYPNGGLAMRIKIFRDGLRGKVADGILVRSSMLVHTDAEAPASYAVQEKFLRELVAATGNRGRALVAQH